MNLLSKFGHHYILLLNLHLHFKLHLSVPFCVLPDQLFKLENYVLILHVPNRLLLQLPFKFFGFSFQFFKNAKVYKWRLGLLCCWDTSKVKNLLAVALLILLAANSRYKLLLVFINFFLESFVLVFVFICFADKLVHLEIVAHFKIPLLTAVNSINWVFLWHTLGRIWPGSMGRWPVGKNYCFLIIPLYTLDIV